uniref:Transmembrane protein 63C n=1 Tax=Scophthalmus maximus TaxID=52904 RepID=A0A8D3E9F4_SCOMX
MIKTHPCAQIFCCDICGFEKVDAEQYYSELEEKRTDEFNAEKNRISMKRLGIAFVTFRDERMTAVIVKDYSRVRCRRRPQQSSITTVLQSHNWGVGYAPAPSDIIWENLSVCGSRWWLRCVLLNILLFLLLFFLTTPAIIVNTMDKFNVTKPMESLRSPVITQFFPTLLLWAFSVLLPFIVYYSAFFESHWTRSGENQVTMHKCFLLLVFMVIVLPSLGLSSLDLFFTWLFDVNFLDEKEVKFQCVFLPDNGAFFVNYVITSSLIGTSMELLRIPALTVYALRLCFAKSQAERIHVKRSQAYEFQFGLEYAWTMCIFAVTMTYSITCPIITPFGLLYVILKHMVDRYNIYYAYVPTKLNQRIHRAAISQVILAPLLCMFWLLFFSVLKLGTLSPQVLSCHCFSGFDSDALPGPPQLRRHGQLPGFKPQPGPSRPLLLQPAHGQPCGLPVKPTPPQADFHVSFAWGTQIAKCCDAAFLPLTSVSNFAASHPEIRLGLLGMMLELENTGAGST